MIKFKLALLLTTLMWLTGVQAFDSFRVDSVRIDGLQRISEGTIFNYLPVEVGDTMTSEAAQQAIRALFQTGFFNDISMARQGNTLIVTVDERPAIASIEIDGNKDIETEDLLRGLADIGLAEGEVFNQISLDRVQQELTRQYFSRGKYNVKIKSDITELQRNRVNVFIEVKEGKAAKIKHINIVGNEAFSDEDILDDFESGTSNWLSWYRNDDQYSREKLSGDLEKLRSYYQDRGYVDFAIESTQVSISPDNKNIYITANVREGEIYTVSEIQLTGDLIVEEPVMRPLVNIKTGEIFSRARLEQSTENITNVLANLGYAFANVTPAPELNREDRTVKIILFVDPGKRVYVRRVNFTGNAKTKDEVLRREMRQFEGGWFSQAAVERSRIRLRRLGYFSDVNIETPQVPGTDDQVDIEVTVEETTAGSFSFGLGFSQIQGLIASIAVTQNNFFGTGNRVGLNLSNSRIFKRIDLSYLNPYYTDNGVSRGFRLSYQELDTADANVVSFLSDSGSFAVNFGFPVTEVDRFNFELGFDRTEIQPSTFTAQEIQDELVELGIGEFRDIVIGTDPETGEPITQPFLDGLPFNIIRGELAWIHDSRNAFFNPTRGSNQRAGIEVALPGSELTYYKIFYRGSKYFPIGRRFALAFNADLGYGDGYGDTEVLPFFEHFYGGGVRSVRGFEDNTLGPRTFGDNPDIRGQPLGGDLKVTGGMEFIFPTPFGKDSFGARLAWFLDFGQIYEDFDTFEADELRYSTGLSLQWQAPVGPIIINLVKTLNDKPGDETETIQFSFGNQF